MGVSCFAIVFNFVPQSGLEPETYALEVRCSILLSYRGVCCLKINLLRFIGKMLHKIAKIYGAIFIVIHTMARAVGGQL